MICVSFILLGFCFYFVLFFYFFLLLLLMVALFFYFFSRLSFITAMIIICDLDYFDSGNIICLLGFVLSSSISSGGIVLVAVSLTFHYNRVRSLTRQTLFLALIFSFDIIYICDFVGFEIENFSFLVDLVCC